MEASASLSLTNLLDSHPHHLAASINTTYVSFYLDGDLLQTLALSGGSVADEDGGVIYVGGWNNRYYEGELQDVRIYLDPLSER